jgi:hypothetical protein
VEEVEVTRLYIQEAAATATVHLLLADPEETVTRSPFDQTFEATL